MLFYSPLLLCFLLLLRFPESYSFLSSGPHVADVNILLPPKMTHPVEFRLQGSDGCFKWTWDHHDVLSVVPEYNTSGVGLCSTSARLKSIAAYEGRKETAVYASDLNTGMVIRCKVYIDKISRIQIFHNSVKLDLDGLATLRVRAFDSEDNIFSSLVGVKFIWQLLPDASETSHSLVHVPLKESPLSDVGGLCGDFDIQAKLEESGVFSDLFVVKGSQIGHEIVSVSLLEHSFEKLTDKISLTVAEAMSLDPPSPIYILIGAVFDFTLNVIRANKPYIVSLPSPFHEWSVTNTSVALVDQSLGTVHAVGLGEAAIIVEDTRVLGHVQISSLHVVLPDYLVLFMTPLSPLGDQIEGVKTISSMSRWHAIAGCVYLIQVKAYFLEQEIYMTDTDEIELFGNNELIWSIPPALDNVTPKKNTKILKATSHGLGKLTATLAYSADDDSRKGVLKVVQEVMVCDQVKFILEEEKIFLPWIPGVYQEFELKASGGCAVSSDEYKWVSSDMSIASVSATGFIQAKRPGTVTFKAVSIFDPLNYNEIEVEVSIPASMVMLPNFPVEMPVGSHFQAMVTLQASNGVGFHACNAFMSWIKWKAEDELFSIVNTTSEIFSQFKQEDIKFQRYKYGIPCSGTYVYASNSGRTRLHATLTVDQHQYTSPSILKASSLIAAYLPLTVHQASDGNQFGGYWVDWEKSESKNQLGSLEYLYLAVGAYIDIMLYRGPERWSKNIEFIENVDLLDESIPTRREGISINQMQTVYGKQYRIRCVNLGIFKLSFKRGNLVGEGHMLPAISEVHLQVFCSLPSSIVIIADEALNTPSVIQSAVQAERTLGRERASPFNVANGRRIRVSAVSVSDSGKPFANSSSLSLRWELNECEGLAFWDEASISSTWSTWERFLILQNASGVCTVRCHVSGLVKSLSHFDSTLGTRSNINSLTDSIQLQLVSSLRVNPDFGLLFFSPEARLNMSITGGSCFLETMVNDSHVLEVTQQKSTCYHQHLILVPKDLGTALVTVQDVGLVPPLAAHSTVQVAEIDWIKISTGHHISIEVGSFRNINFLAGIVDGRTFDPSQYIYMKIRVQFDEPIAEVVEGSYVHFPHFTIKAARVGVTALYLYAIQHSGQEIVSQPVKVEVYSPVKLHPSDIFLVPGASYVLTVKGGPKTGSHVKYSSGNDQSAKIHEFSGRVSAISPGNSTIVATVYGDNEAVLCEAYGKITVGIPLSALLYSQSEQLAVGRTMPIHASLSEGNLFSFYELCGGYRWSVEDENVLKFVDAHHTNGARQETVNRSSSFDGQDLNFVQVLHGLSAGKTKITVSLSCNYKFSDSSSKSVAYSASLSVLVVPDLPLALGSSITWILPPYYTSSSLLPLASDTYRKEDSPGDTGISYSLLEKFTRKTDEMTGHIQIEGDKIITKGPNNLACIQGMDRSSGRTEVISCVRVAEVSQLRITTDDFPVYSLSIGTELNLLVKDHDNLGNPFHETFNFTVFEVETNFPDVVSIEAHDGHKSITIRAISQGTALLRVGFRNNHEKSVFAVIFCGPHLYPQNPVIQEGSSIDFRIESFDDSASGQWSSANDSIVFVNKLSGRAEARGEGATRISFQGPKLRLHTTVNVLKGNSLLVDAPRELLTNVPFPAEGYPFPVKHSDLQSHRHSSLLDCQVYPSGIGYAKPWKDKKTGDFYCLFFPYLPEHLGHKWSNSQVPISIKASLKGDHNVTGSASAIFIGGFAILDMDSLYFNLNPVSGKRLISIVGNSGVEVNWNNKSHLVIKPGHRGDAAEGKLVQYEVTVIGNEKFNDQIIFSLPTTGQRVEIDVSYNPEEQEVIAAEASSPISWAIVLAMLLLMIAPLAAGAYYLFRQERSQPATSSSSPDIAAPATPQRGSTFKRVNYDESPRTPPPFIDYIRQTIDDTPYYKQQWRRRINPQHTY